MISDETSGYGPARSEESSEGIGDVITGFTKHGIDNSVDRSGGAASQKAVLDAVKNPIKVEQRIDSQGETSTR